MPDNKKIMIVDDTKLGRLSVRKILNKAGLEDIEECSDGETALSLMKKSQFDLVLMDILMPGIGGMETLIRIKKDFPETKVYMVSADIQETTRQRCEAAGADGFINKPINHEKLNPVLQDLNAL